ncbi:hypothetical protein EWB00_010533, partial [Schistosoma japonicum]
MNISTVLLLIKLLPISNQQDNEIYSRRKFSTQFIYNYTVGIIEIYNAVLVNTTTNENILWNANFNDPTTHDYKHLFHLLCALVLKWGKSVMYLGSDDGVCTEIIFSPADVQQSAETQNSHVVAKSTSAFTFPFVLAYDGHHIKNLLDAKYEEYNTHMNLKVDTYEASVNKCEYNHFITHRNYEHFN